MLWGLDSLLRSQSNMPQTCRTGGRDVGLAALCHLALHARYLARRFYHGKPAEGTGLPHQVWSCRAVTGGCLMTCRFENYAFHERKTLSWHVAALVACAQWNWQCDRTPSKDSTCINACSAGLLECSAAAEIFAQGRTSLHLLCVELAVLMHGLHKLHSKFMVAGAALVIVLAQFAHCGLPPLSPGGCSWACCQMPGVLHGANHTGGEGGPSAAYQPLP